MPLQVLVSSTRNATFKKQVASRLRETLVFFENCALVYAKHYFFSARLAGLGAAVPMRRLTTPKNVCSRLRETLLFKNVPLQVLVSSTRNATFKKQVAPRLRETLVFLENCALVYAKHYFFASSRMGLSRQAPLASWQEAPRRPGPVTGQSSHFFLHTLCGKIACNFRPRILAWPKWLSKRNGASVYRLPQMVP